MTRAEVAAGSRFQERASRGKASTKLQPSLDRMSALPTKVLSGLDDEGTGAEAPLVLK